MVDFDWENIDPNTPDEEMYELYVGSTLPVPEPVIVEDPQLPAPSQTSLTSVSQVEPTQRIPATAPMEEGEEPQHYSNSNHFSYGYTNGQIHWPKQFTNFQRKAMPKGGSLSKSSFTHSTVALTTQASSNWDL